ncbi:MAG: LysR family transcriptional regulator [Achromobacter sp.]|uniref:HTH-type transcriptional regulator PgrR n=1 Tax=Achromobacter piechaudii TaxID=72556 RepID=A0ABN7EZB9_9BURK|nr:LysR family transcriptional regulator [Achromobacter piechaudii]MPS76860.1 LysR family transcriptional regulator [Achromobacter sp.]CAB3700506.1 HTH-type transcriptional regulator PgrR [Achromobacter piechaudii]CAB3851938.1 HTH-type transcriptional regulator PgrR [Achromobacter piechaudii]CAB3950825.1 HTH-type transcriptional regulator PgrR [Achromobacter piechaudii]
MQADNLSHLAAFAALARHCSFRRAGEELGLSTSAVSYAIRSLEERLGVNLFNRTTRSVALTDAGQRLAERLLPALNDLGDALEEMNHFRGSASGTLRINTSRAASYMLLMPMAARFLAAYPDIRLEIAEDDSFVDIVASGFDAGVRLLEAVPEDMVAVQIGPALRAAVVASPDYMAGRPLPRHPDELLRHECVRYRFPSGRYYKWEFEKDGDAIEVDVTGRIALSDVHAELRAAVDGIGISCVPEHYARDGLQSGRLVRMLDDWCPTIPGFMLYYPRQRRVSSALRAFIDMARQTGQG